MPTLRDLIDSPKQLDELGVARIIANIAEVVHKQQKGGQPLNTLTPDAIAVAADGDASLSPVAARSAYTAPERLRGEPGDRRSDVFSLGAILWEALAHEPLFRGEIEGEIMAAVLEGEYRSAAEANANVPAELDAICRKALSRAPADRYPSCKVMAAEIATVLDDAEYPEDNSAIADYLANRYVKPEPKPIVIPTSRATPVPGSPIVVERPATQTLQGMSPRAEIEAAKARQTLVAPGELKKPSEPRKKSPSAAPMPALKRPEPATEEPRAKTPSSQPIGTDASHALTPPAADAPRAKTPSQGGGLPSWAMAQPAQPDPTSTLPGVPAMLDKPPAESPKQAFSKTAVLGSLSSADIAPQPLPPVLPATSSPNVPIGKKTEVHGSASIADRLAAINNANMPGLPAVPPGADPALAKNITTAETVPTPALAGYAAAEAKAAAALDAVKSLPPTPIQTPPPSDAVAMPAAGTGTAVAAEESSVHPASVVTLPRAKSKSEAGRARTEGGVRDPLAGWGWGTGPHEAISADDDEYYDTQKSTRKRLVLAIGGAAGVVLLVIVAAFAFGGDKDDEKKQTDVSAKQTEPAVDWSQPTEPPAPDPSAGSAIDPSAVANAGSAVDPNAGSAAEPAKPDEPAAVEPPQPEPPVVEPEPEPEPEAVAKVEPKPEPEKPEVKKPEPKKPEPKPRVVRDPKPKNRSWDPLAPKPKRARDPRPVDPYAEKKPAIDANVAYKTGIQQFARGDANGALTTFRASLAANPGFAPTWRGIGMVYEKLGKRSQAKTAFRRYLQLSPRAGDAEQIRERMERL